MVTETGLDDVLTLPVDVIDRRTWARRHLDGLRPVLETLATTMQDSLAADLDEADDEDVAGAHLRHARHADGRGRDARASWGCSVRSCSARRPAR